jgi:hypothetical protein
MCLFFGILFLGPRFGLLVYWIGWPARWDLAFDSALVPLLGFVLAPWTTLAWVICAPGGITGADVALIGFAVLIDLVTLLGSGGTSNRRRNRHAVA